jgi:hypothetical protein
VTNVKKDKPVLHYFFNHSFRRHLTARALFESYTKQLLYHLESIGKTCPPDVIARLTEFYGPKKTPPSLDEVVEDLLLPLLLIVHDPTLIVDGVDECSQKEVQKVLSVLRKLDVVSKCRTFISCREEINVTERFPGSIRIRVTPENTKADMELFIEHMVDTMAQDHRIAESPEIVAYIKRQLLDKADRMSVWPFKLTYVLNTG